MPRSAFSRETTHQLHGDEHPEANGLICFVDLLLRIFIPLLLPGLLLFYFFFLSHLAFLPFSLSLALSLFPPLAGLL